MPKSVFTATYKAFLEEFRAARQEAGSQEEIARRLGKTQTFLSKCERGERRVDIAELLAFCEVIDLDAAELIRRVQNRRQKTVTGSRRHGR